MSAFEVFVAIYMAAVPPALGYLFWGRMNRLENRVDGLELKVLSEISGLRAELSSDIANLRTEMRQEVTALRLDLTQVALAVGARPRASEA